jgi:cytochrome c oxidase subunit 1
MGSWVLALGLFWTLAYLLASFKWGARAPHNPWGGVSLEWHTATPPIEHNFHTIPRVTGSPYDFPEIDRSGKH